MARTKIAKHPHPRASTKVAGKQPVAAPKHPPLPPARAGSKQASDRAVEQAQRGGPRGHHGGHRLAVAFGARVPRRRGVAAIADGSVPAGLTVTELARTLPHSWAEQHKLLGLHT